jgi:hypothetical protein
VVQYSCDAVLSVLHARGWRLGRSWARFFLADYGVPLMVLAWSGLLFAVTPTPGVPRRVATPNTWEVRGLLRVGGSSKSRGKSLQVD